MAEPATSVVALLFTDIEGSTRLWEARPREMGAALARHDALLRETVEGAGGTVFKTVGDAFCVAFADPAAAVGAAAAAQRALVGEGWGEIGPLRVRMALHAGAVEARDGDYFGRPLNRVARLLAAGHGGQILLSQAVAESVADRLPDGAALRDLGEHWLKDLPTPERVVQLVVPGLPDAFPPLRTGPNLRQTIPLPPTPLLGREAVIADIQRLLGLPDGDLNASAAGARLVTLTGPGGAGKTRLAIELAHALTDAFADGVAFVSLAAIADPALVAPEIAATLGIRDPGGGAPRDALIDTLRHRRLLLVLDNFEQVTAAAPLVADLLAGCPRLAVLATSRGPLHLRGEAEVPVPPLALPEEAGAAFGAARGAGEAPSAAAALASPAVRLFVERAAAAKPGFALTDENAAAVVEICRRLDGLPLGIELAAARSRLLSPAALLARFERRLDLLAGGARDLPARHQTMRDAIAWSHDLLDPAEQRLFARLAIFVGGADLTAAEAVCDEGVAPAARGVSLRSGGGGGAGRCAPSGGEGARDAATPPVPPPPSPPPPPEPKAAPPERSGTPSVLDALESLAGKSLVRIVAEEEDEPRVVMLDVIRDYALERLDAGGERPDLAGRHAAWFLALVEEAEGSLEGPEQTRWLDRLEREVPNLRAASGWLRAAEAGVALRMAGALWRFWWLRGDVAEGRTWLETLLREAVAADPAVRAKALNGAGVLAESQGDCDAAAAFHEESLAISRGLGDARGVAWSLNNLGVVAIDQGDLERAEALLGESLAVAEAEGDRSGIAAALTDLGQIAHYRGELDRAVEVLNRALSVIRQLGNVSQLARVSNNLGSVEIERADYDSAQPLLAESLRLHQIVGDKLGIASTLNNLGEVARGLGEEDSAEALYAESHARAVESGHRLYAAIALENLAGVARRRGDARAADERYRAALALHHSVGDGMGMAVCLTGLAELAGGRGESATAARLLGASAAVREAHDLPPPEEIDWQAVERAARDVLGDTRFIAAWDEGRTTPLAQVVAEQASPRR